MKLTAILILIMIAAAAGLVLLRSGDEATDTASPQTQLEASGDWPIFRGDPGLRADSDGEAGDRLRLVWKSDTAGAVRSSPVIADGLVFVGNDAGRLVALRLDDGAEQWSYSADDAIVAPPLVVGATVYVGTLAGDLLAVNAADGELLWTYSTDGEIHGSANSAAVGDETRILVGSYDGKLHCVRSADGEGLWTYATEDYINGAPAISDGLAVFGGCDFHIRAVRVGTGESAGSLRLGEGSYIAASPAIAKDIAFAGTYDNRFVAAEMPGGPLLWEHSASAAFFSPPAIAGGVVVAGCRDRRVYCFDAANGEVLWRFITNGKVDGGAVVAGSRVIVGSDGGKLYVLDLDDGKETFSYALGGAISTSPAVVNGAVIVGCEDGYVYAFAPAETTDRRFE
ncbi:MAG: PQQ-binding-like beta-propeller repeat protein [Phycisphaerae bacterium]